jgi:7-carboxy-7-deazaguanine synthase
MVIASPTTPTKTDKRFPIIEVFGPTIQGEGVMAGRPTHFVRMGGCDYRCRWCDTDYAVLPNLVRQNSIKLSTREIFGKVMELDTGPEWITISGGNPALHDLTQLVDALHEAKFKVAVETQGSLWKEWLGYVNQLTISPKPPSSNMECEEDLEKFLVQYSALRLRVPHTRGHAACLKVPVIDERDYEYAIGIHEKYPTLPFYFSVVTKMGGLDGHFSGGEIDTRDTLLDRYRWLAERVAGDPRAADTTSIPQLHALLWGFGGRGF